MELARQKQARIFAAQIRIETLKALGHLGFGHLGGSLSIADLLAVLYSGEMKVDPSQSQLGGPGFPRLLQGPRWSGDLCHTGTPGLLPQGGAADHQPGRYSSAQPL